MEEKYNVYLNTPIGKKYGSVALTIACGRVSGVIDILGRRQAFEGVINDDGECRIEGVMSTLLRTFSYTATGKIDSGSLRLRLTGDRNGYELVGTREAES